MFKVLAVVISSLCGATCQKLPAKVEVGSCEPFLGAQFRGTVTSPFRGPKNPEEVKSKCQTYEKL